MSILSAIKQQNSSIDDLAALPQALIMQMAQKKQISEEMLAPILARKAELADAFARQNALQNNKQTPPTVMEQLMAQNAQAENPASEQMPQEMTQQMPQEMSPDMGVSQLPIPERQYAGGGIIAFADGGLSDDEEDDKVEMAMAKHAASRMNDYEPNFETRQAKGSPQSFPNSERSVGIASDREKTKQVTDEDQARKYNVGNLRPSGFTYPGQIGLSKGKFAMFDSPEAGLNALHHDIGIKLNRGLDTPTKFISVYAPEKDNNKVDVYSKNVAKMLGIGPNDKIPNTPESKQLLANAIIRQEGAHKATAAFAHGGEVKHFQFGGSTMGGFDDNYTDVGVPLVSNIDEYVIDPMTGERMYSGYKKPSSKDSSAPTKQKNKDSKDQPAFDKNAAVDQYLNEYLANTKPLTPSGTTAQKAAEESFFEKAMARNEEERKRINESAKEDKNLALLAAGLGMMGGTSPYAMANIGQGGLQGIQALAASKTRRAAELTALNKGEATQAYYGEMAKERQERGAMNKANQLRDDFRTRENDIRTMVTKMAASNPRISSLPPDQQQVLIDKQIRDALSNDQYYKSLASQLGLQATSTPSAPIPTYNPKTRSLG
jgi:hypothetical protein